MTDDELLAAFEAATLEAFPHEMHVRVAWCYLTRLPLLAAVARFRESLRHFAAVKGAAGKYHETLTVAYMLIIAERVMAAPVVSWNDFIERNRDLMSSAPSPLAPFYSAEVLASADARERFVMPDVHSSWEPSLGTGSTAKE